MRDLQAELEFAKAEHANSLVNQSNAAARHGQAIAALKLEQNNRASLIATASAGGEPDLVALDRAGAQIAQAEATVAIWRDAQAGAVPAVVAAQKVIDDLSVAIGKQNIVIAARDCIRLGKIYEDAFFAMHDAQKQWIASSERLQKAASDGLSHYNQYPSRMGFTPAEVLSHADAIRQRLGIYVIRLLDAADAEDAAATPKA